MAYHCSKDRALPDKGSGEDDPFAILLAKLSGSSPSKPRKPHAFDLWAVENQEVFATAMTAAIQERNPTRFQLAGLRTSVKKAEFDKLPENEKEEWREKVKQVNDESIQDWKNRLITGPSTKPEDLQRQVYELHV
jgi:hypothetical protein